MRVEKQTRRQKNMKKAYRNYVLLLLMVVYIFNFIDRQILVILQESIKAELGLHEIVSFTAKENHASRRVMEKIGMKRDPSDDFNHPLLPVGHHLRRHVLYRLP